ncbi:MAG: hypothetical protein J0L94_00795 [Rhodothermia bacterium]|nr:hypothetical protein [Rhodothermia bacterium]
MKNIFKHLLTLNPVCLLAIIFLSGCSAAQNEAYWNQVRENHRNQEWAEQFVGNYSGVIYSETIDPAVPTPVRRDHSFTVQVTRVSNQRIRVVIPNFTNGGRTYRADFEAQLGLVGLFNTNETVDGIQINGGGAFTKPEGSSTFRLTLRYEFTDGTRGVVLNMNPLSY